jgi:predicted DNA-binding protein with PD1-like motif
MALIHILGALRDGKAVTGPEIAVIPPVPHFERFEGGWELIAVATLYPSSEGPKLHIHASTGREKAVLTGCIREKAQVYLTIEAVVIELDDMAASRKLDDKSGQYLLKLAEKA